MNLFDYIKYDNEGCAVLSGCIVEDRLNAFIEKAKEDTFKDASAVVISSATDSSIKDIVVLCGTRFDEEE